MIIKDSTVKIENLHPVLKGLIPELAKLHMEFTSNPLVITSGNDDIHWGGIKEKNRPFGWQDADEGMVRTKSDSAHYLDEAFDFRKKCPYKKKTYFNDLSKEQQELFLSRAREIFPKQRFDVVECAFCLHVEWDPKWTVDIPEIIKDEPEYKLPVLGDLKTHKEQREAVVSILERLWFELDGKAVALGTMNFISKRLTGYGFFKDRLNLNKDQSVWGKLLELINELIKKLRRTES